MKMKMKKTRGFAAILAAAMICSVSATAEMSDSKIEINGRRLENARLLQTDDGVMMPLRAVCEALGYEVKWDGDAERIDIINLPVYITCRPDTDGYTFAKTAPMKLGRAPIMVNDTTYVPLNFVTEILEDSYETTEYGISIKSTDENSDGKVKNTISAYIKEKTEEGLLVENFDMGEIRVVVSDETVIKDENGKSLSVDELDKSKQLNIRLSDAMTLSLPPMSNALEITQTGELAKAVIEGKISEIVKDSDGKVVQLILDNNKVALNVDDSLKIKDFRESDSREKAPELEVGMYVRAETAGISTRSIPPQYPTFKINILAGNGAVD